MSETNSDWRDYTAEVPPSAERVQFWPTASQDPTPFIARPGNLSPYMNVVGLKWRPIPKPTLVRNQFRSA